MSGGILLSELSIHTVQRELQKKQKKTLRVYSRKKISINKRTSTMRLMKVASRNFNEECQIELHSNAREYIRRQVR